jgi:hypothetical protein
MEGRAAAGRVWPMELSLPPSPVHLAGLRQATRACLRGVASEAADDVVLALNEAATNAIGTGQAGAAGPGGSPRQRQRDPGVRA